MVINVKTKLSSYDVIIENNILNNASNYFNLNRKVLIVTDSGIPTNYVEIIKKQCKEVFIYTFKQGEKSKNIKNFEKILSYLIEKQFTRTDCIVALGGGVVGDLAGFVASTFNRGIDFYNIPTTLLSQVDSSIGGKTAIDFNGYKNIVGAFYPPKCVLIDPLTLKTLDKRQLKSGLVEIIKMAVSLDKELFDYIYNEDDVFGNISYIIEKSLLIKKDIIEKDEYESNIRKVLNFGHTIGHVIESHSKMKLLHGECVGIGMLYFSSSEIKDKLIYLLNKYNLPTSYSIDNSEIEKIIMHDKKVSGNKIDIIYVDTIGNYKIIKKEINEIFKGV